MIIKIVQVGGVSITTPIASPNFSIGIQRLPLPAGPEHSGISSAADKVAHDPAPYRFLVPLFLFTGFFLHTVLIMWVWLSVFQSVLRLNPTSQLW